MVTQWVKRNLQLAESILQHDLHNHGRSGTLTTGSVSQSACSREILNIPPGLAIYLPLPEFRTTEWMAGGWSGGNLVLVRHYFFNSVIFTAH
jgi:hypothetical protein